MNTTPSSGGEPPQYCGKRTSSARVFGVPLLNRNGPVPIIPLATHVPGLSGDRGRLDDRLVRRLADEVRERPVGDERRNSTVYGPLLITPAGERRLLGIAEKSCDVAADMYCLKLATTSSALKVLPLWNLTPRRSWNVQTVAFVFAFQLVASAGLTCSCWLEKVRYSPIRLAKASEPASLSRTGSKLEPALVAPTRIVPPRFCATASVAPNAASSPM